MEAQVPKQLASAEYAHPVPTWDSDLYLRFAGERLQPAIDLVARIALDSPACAVDLGCGPGNSTAVLARRWPQTALIGVDNSAAVLAAARRDYPQGQWVAADIAAWRADAPVDLMFSNAALQWVPDHAAAFPRLFDQVSRRGAFAVQMPADLDAPPHVLMRDLAASPAWRSHFTKVPRTWHVHEPGFYYDVLAPRAARLDLWTTEYQHVLDSVDDVLEWYRGTGLRPWLDALSNGEARERFLADYRTGLQERFVPQPDGRLLLPFRRLFVIAYR